MLFGLLSTEGSMLVLPFRSEMFHIINPRKVAIVGKGAKVIRWEHNELVYNSIIVLPYQIIN